VVELKAAATKLFEKLNGDFKDRQIDRLILVLEDVWKHGENAGLDRGYFIPHSLNDWAKEYLNEFRDCEPSEGF
jgi:hypothetical protein